MESSAVSPPLAALGIGVALAAAPGPVQAVLLAESVRGGVAAGLRALAGVHVTFGVLLLSLAILLNPGGWLFLGAVASPLLVTAARHGGTAGAVMAAAALVVGVASGDLALVALSGLGLRRAGERAVRVIRLVLALVLAGLGLWLLLTAAL